MSHVSRRWICLLLDNPQVLLLCSSEQADMVACKLAAVVMDLAIWHI